MEQIAALCDRVIWVDGGGIRASGEAAEVIQLYEDTTETEEEDGIRLRLDAEGRAALCPANGSRDGGSHVRSEQSSASHGGSNQLDPPNAS